MLTSLKRFLKTFWQAAVIMHQGKKISALQQSVKYLGLIISEGTRAIGQERIKPILNHPLPVTLRQFERLWGKHRLLLHLDSGLWGTSPAFI